MPPLPRGPRIHPVHLRTGDRGVQARPGQRAQHRGEFAAQRPGQPELPGPRPVPGPPQLEVPPVAVQPIIGQRPVRIDVVHHLLGQHPQLLRPEAGGEPGQQLLTLIQIGRIEPAALDRAQRPLDDRHLLGIDLPAALRGGQIRPDRPQRLPGQAHPLPDRRGRPDPTRRLTRGDPQHARPRPHQAALGQLVGQLPPPRIGNDPMIGQPQPVPDPLQPRHETHEPHRVQGIQPTVLDQLHQMIHPDTQLIQRAGDRRPDAVG